MKTPIFGFVRSYCDKNTVRMHMPGHKGMNLLGCENIDITEVSGADALYEADGIIAESEANATALFGTGATLYSTEGSTQCIKAMLYLASARGHGKTILAARNAHKAFVYGAALLDLNVKWMYAPGSSLCSCIISPEQLESELQAMEEVPCAVYVTSPDYLGGMSDIKALAEVCHRYGTILLVDNAHGAYLHFLENSCHPMDLGADLCCDSAHKTLPVLTGGAYLHLSGDAPADLAPRAKQAMSLFGSTSPSYLILQSLDLCNRYLEAAIRDRLKTAIDRVNILKDGLKSANWRIYDGEPLKITIEAPDSLTGHDLAEKLRTCGIEPEYADRDYLVLMPSAVSRESDLDAVRLALGVNALPYSEKAALSAPVLEKAMSLHDAIMRPSQTIAVENALGKICAAPTVSCPPAIPVAVCGEVIDSNAIDIFRVCGIISVSVII